MRYIGSKTLLLNQIEQIVCQCCAEGVFFDPFGGIGTVGAHMKKMGFRVISGDLLLFAHYFQKTIIECNQFPDFRNVMPRTWNKGMLEEYISNQVEKDGWLVEEYAVERHYFTLENAYHIQGCINCIWEWKKQGLIDETEYAVLIASVIQTMDIVANTAGTYYAYLKQFYRKAKKEYKFKFLVPISGNMDCICELEDANKLVKRHLCDILYLDPPYNERDYGSYYHLPETIASGQIPIPKGKSGIYVNSNKRSQYTKKSQAETAFYDLIENSRSNFILFHYTDDGLISIEYARKVLRHVGNVEEYYFDCKGYHTTPVDTKTKHHIFKVDRR